MSATRRAALQVWGAMLLVPLLALALAAAARRGAGPDATAALLALTAGVSLLHLVLSRLAPERLGPFGAGREATIFARLVVAWALCEAAALFPLVAFVVSGDPRLLAVLGADLLALALLYPGHRRWEGPSPTARLAPGRSR